MYLDAFVATEQCEALKYVVDTTESSKNKAPEEIVKEDDEKADLALLYCYDNWLRFEKSFKLSTQSDEIQKYNYRSISKDAMRCQLIYIPIQILRKLYNNGSSEGTAEFII